MSGKREVEVTIVRTTRGEWVFNGETASGLETCVDLDLGFTPAMNLLALGRLDLREGQGATVPAAWFNAATSTLAVPPQRYERRTESTYWYEAPSVNYFALIEVTAYGFIRRYPGLWEAEP